MYEEDFVTDFVVKIHNYISYDETEELVSYDLDAVKCWRELFDNDDKAISIMKKHGVMERPELILATTLGTKILRILSKEIVRMDEHTAQSFAQKISDMVEIIVFDNVSSVKIDFGQKENLVLELENPNA